MKVYIIQQGGELKIIKVQPQDEAAFLEKCQTASLQVVQPYRK
jgi:hypothetical protein